MTPKKKRTYWLVIDQYLQPVSDLCDDKEYAEGLAIDYRHDFKQAGKRTKFKVLRVTLTASPAGWK